MTKNKTIVIFNGFYLPHLGGVERYTAGLVYELKKDYNIFIVTTNVPTQKNVEEKDGITIFRLPTQKILKNRFPILKKNATYKNLFSRIRGLDISHVIINTRYYETSLLGLKIAKEKGLTPIIIDHSSDYILKPYEIIQNKKIMKYNPIFYTVSECTAKWLKTLGIKSEGVFYNSTNQKKDFKKTKNKKTRIIFAGRLMKEKGVNLLVNSYEKLKDKYDVELEIIGDGPLYKNIKEKHKDIILTGTLSHNEALKEMEKADIFAFPTLYPEGFPTVILEAAMEKCAIISTDRGGVKELIEDGKTGIIIENDASDLTDRIEDLLKNPEKSRRLGENAFKKVNENFTWKKTVDKVRKELAKYERN